MDGNNQPIDLTGWVIKFEIKTGKQIIYNAPISVFDALAGEILLEMWDVEIAPYNYNYEVIMTNSTGYTLTYMVGRFSVIK